MPLKMYKPKSTKREEGATKALAKKMGGGMMMKRPGMKKVKTKIGTIIIRPIVSIFGILSFIIYS